MAFSLVTDLDKRLDGLLFNASTQARNVAFNINFNNLQNTAIDRLNGEIADIANVKGNQRELDALHKTYNKFVADRESIRKFALTNQANRDYLNEVTTKATATLSSFTLGDADTDNLSASELATFEENLATIVDKADRLIELSHPQFSDGNTITRLRTLVSELQSLTPEEGVIDVEGTDPATNDNFAITEKLREITTVSAAAADTSLNLEYLSNDHIFRIDAKLKGIKNDMNDVSIFRAGEIEYEIQILRTKYATFLRSIEIAFDMTAQGSDAMLEALQGPKDPEPGSILSIFA